jgi:hypothetical protein
MARFLARRWGLASASSVPLHALWVAAGRPWSLRRNGPRALTAGERAQLGAWPHYALGADLGFDDAGDGHQRLGAGWWFPEPHGVWARSGCAVIMLPLAAQPAVDELRLRLRLHAAIAPRRPRQEVTVVFGRRQVASCTIDAARPEVGIDVEVPARELTREIVAVISICSAPVMTPADSRLNSDLRQIGVGLSSLQLAS